MTDAASRVRVVLVSLPGLLYRISTPAGSGLAPVAAERGGRVRAGLRVTGADGPDEVLIVLNSAVRWDLRLPAGAGEQQFDLSRGWVTRVETGASGLIEMRLPEPRGTLPLTFAAGAGTVLLSVPGRAPLRLRLDGGAAAANTPWTGGDAVPAGAVLFSPGWPDARDRYAIRARSGVGVLTLRRLCPAAR